MASPATGSPEEREIIRRNCERFREELGLQQNQAAERAGVDKASLWRYEHGRSTPDRDALRKLSAAYGRPVDDFYNPHPPPRDPDRAAQFDVRFKIVGEPPPGLEDELQRVIAKYTPDEAEKRRRARDMLRKRPEPPRKR